MNKRSSLLQKSINYGQKSFITLGPGVNFIKLFWCNSQPHWCNLSQNLWQYANSCVNYAEKSFFLIDQQAPLFENFLQPFTKIYYVLLCLALAYLSSLV
jgi:hypothetical protein